MEDFTIKGLSFTKAVTVISWTLFNQHKTNLYLYYLKVGLLPKYAYQKANEN